MQLMRHASSSGVTNGLHNIVSCSAASQILELPVSKGLFVIFESFQGAHISGVSYDMQDEAAFVSN